MRIAPGAELAYCTNVHAGEGWAEVHSALDRHLPPLRAALSPGASFGVGLRLSDRASRELLEGDALARFADWLTERGLHVRVINGFPYGGFHRTRVKDAVYAPDWTRRERLDYTLRLARILAGLLPEGGQGSISTVPLSYKPWHTAGHPGGDAAWPAVGAGVLAACADTVIAARDALARIEAETGRLVHLDLEPEPDCALETMAETAAFFREHLLPRGEEARTLRHVRVCWDVCHAAVEYERPAQALAELEACGIAVGRLQLSSALKADLGAPAARREVAERLRPFAEGTYLHQVVERRADGSLRRHRDLPDALARVMDPGAREWRIHFHVPLFCADAPGLLTTQAELRETLALWRARRFTGLLEMETYTWEVLPPALQGDLHAGLLREYDWVLSTLGEGETACAA